MSDDIRLDRVAPTGTGPRDAGSLALQPSPDDVVVLSFRLTAPDDAALDAVRHARRSILREERTLGVGPDDPSLESAVFSSGEITWTVSHGQIARCLELLEDLVRRANRTHDILRRG